MNDEHYMGLALAEAKISYNREDLPVGAVLTIDGMFIGSTGNSANTRDDWTSHAEYSLINQLSRAIKTRKSGWATLYTTWEPCLMCMGSSVLSRVSEIVYALPDPIGGVARLDPKNIGGWYEKKWPRIKEGPLGDESFNLLEKFMMEHHERWGDFLVKLRRGLGK